MERIPKDVLAIVVEYMLQNEIQELMKLNYNQLVTYHKYRKETSLMNLQLSCKTIYLKVKNILEIFVHNYWKDHPQHEVAKEYQVQTDKWTPRLYLQAVGEMIGYETLKRLYYQRFSKHGPLALFIQLPDPLEQNLSKLIDVLSSKENIIRIISSPVTPRKF